MSDICRMIKKCRTFVNSRAIRRTVWAILAQMRTRSVVVVFGTLTALFASGYGVMFTVLDEFRDQYGISEGALGLIVAMGFFVVVRRSGDVRAAGRSRPRPADDRASGWCSTSPACSAWRSATTVMLAARGAVRDGLGVGLAYPAVTPDRHPRRPGAPGAEPRAAARRRRRRLRRSGRRSRRCSSARSASPRRSC